MGYDERMSIRRKRMRSTIKWGGAVVTVLLLIVWVGSGWFKVGFSVLPVVAAGIHRGEIRVVHEQPCSWWSARFHEFGVGLNDSGERFGWWFEYKRIPFPTSPPSYSHRVAVPIWFLILLAAAPRFLIWRSDRKRDPNACRKCGYSRTGLPADRACPECGAASLRRAAGAG